jgi:hypothetical protein
MNNIDSTKLFIRVNLIQAEARSKKNQLQTLWKKLGYFTPFRVMAYSINV